jgi:hypothetical protein
MIRPLAEFPYLPHARYASSPEGLRRLILDVLSPFPDADLSFLEDQIPHEMEHAAAARALGCISHFTFSMIPRPGGWHALPGHQWASRGPLSKLAIAAIAAAPAQLSLDDLTDLRRMGYRDAADVADRIRRFNRHAQHPLPMPANSH